MLYNYIVYICVYICKVRAPNFTKQKLMDIKSQIGPDTIILSDFLDPHSLISRYVTHI